MVIVVVHCNWRALLSGTEPEIATVNWCTPHELYLDGGQRACPFGTAIPDYDPAVYAHRLCLSVLGQYASAIQTRPTWPRHRNMAHSLNPQGTSLVTFIFIRSIDCCTVHLRELGWADSPPLKKGGRWRWTGRETFTEWIAVVSQKHSNQRAIIGVNWQVRPY